MTNTKTSRRVVSELIAIALALGSIGCEQKPNEKHDAPRGSQAARTQPQYQTRQISGEVLTVDEDSFPIHGNYGGSQFSYEIIRVKNTGGSIRQLLIPQPAHYRAGDKIEGNYSAPTKFFG